MKTTYSKMVFQILILNDIDQKHDMSSFCDDYLAQNLMIKPFSVLLFQNYFISNFVL